MDGCDQGFEVFGRASIAIEPGEGAFDDPWARLNVEAFGISWAFDDLGGPSTDSFQGCFEFGSGTGAVGEDMAQPLKGMADGSEQGGGAVAAASRSRSAALSLIAAGCVRLWKINGLRIPMTPQLRKSG